MDYRNLRMAVKKPRGLGSLREISSGSWKDVPYLFPVLLRVTESGESERRRGEREMEERESEREKTRQPVKSGIWSYSRGGQRVARFYAVASFWVDFNASPPLYFFPNRKYKLWVLDLKDFGPNFWSMWGGASTPRCTSHEGHQWLSPSRWQSSMWLHWGFS